MEIVSHLCLAVAFGFALVLASYSPALAEQSPVDYASNIGAGFLTDMMGSDKCKTLPEAALGASSAIASGLLGSVIGGVIGANLSGSGTGAGKGAAIGGVLGALVGKVGEDHLGAIGQQRRYELGLCKVISAGATLRKPLFDRVSSHLGLLCNMQQTNIDLQKPLTWKVIKICAAHDPIIQKEVTDSLVEIYQVNHSTCIAATEYTESFESAEGHRALLAGRSFIPLVKPVCDHRSPEEIWTEFYKIRS